jgi:hypothetical protein
MLKSHEDLLDAYALLTVRSGLNITPGQQLVICDASRCMPMRPGQPW